MNSVKSPCKHCGKPTHATAWYYFGMIRNEWCDDFPDHIDLEEKDVISKQHICKSCAKKLYTKMCIALGKVLEIP